MTCLRAWQDDPNAIVEGDRTVVQEINILLESYICECISYGPDRLGGWWSDGVIHLQIDCPLTNCFKLLGVTWIDSHGIAPFEIDVATIPGNDTHFAKTTFRLGMLDAHGQPRLCSANLAASRVLEMRPQQDRDWAIAIELTPSSS